MTAINDLFPLEALSCRLSIRIAIPFCKRFLHADSSWGGGGSCEKESCFSDHSHDVDKIDAVLSGPITPLGRREFLKAWLAASAPLVMAACGQTHAEAGGRQPATPACEDDDDPTPASIEGPFYTPRSPERASLLEPGIGGTRIVLAGQVLSRVCKPIPRALLDFWHAGDRGDYDNVGFRWRGHQYADAGGRYRLETIVPGEYGFRTRHYHVKVQAPDSRILTTQLYFPGEPRNRRDFLFRPELLMSVRDAEGAKRATFDFILNVP